MLELLALALAFVHFGFPLAYYWYAKAKWLRKPWNLKLNGDYRPKVTVILPTRRSRLFKNKDLNRPSYTNLSDAMNQHIACICGFWKKPWNMRTVSASNGHAERGLQNP